MLTQTETDEGSSKIDELLAELEKETLPEDSTNSEKIKDKQAADTLNKIKHEKPDWADKKDDEHNTYDYSEKITNDKEDEEW